MYDFFYNFYKKPYGFDLFTRNNSDNTNSPPVSEERITEDGQTRITEDGQIRVTE